MFLHDAILEFCKENDLDPSTVGNLVSKSLKEKKIRNDKLKTT